jgi:hypothetical protein
MSVCTVRDFILIKKMKFLLKYLYLQIFVIPISASSKLIQLRTILSNKSAGQVSRTGWAIAAYGSFGMID